MTRLPLLLALTLGPLAIASCKEDYPAEPESSASPQPLPVASSPGAAAPAELIPGQYIVVLRRNVPNAQSAAQSLLVRHGGKLKQTYNAALKGMVLELSDAAVAQLRRDPAVEYIEQDQVVHVDGAASVQLTDGWAPASLVFVQGSPPWGLDRLDHRFFLQNSYRYEPRGVGVRIYVIDTGIKFDHNDFGSPTRASLGFDAMPAGTGGVDCHGQGTHLAATAGGNVYGVAKRVALKAVRVFDCAGSSTISQIIAGVDWVTANRVLPAVAVMGFSSFHGSPTLNAAVNSSIASGVTYAVSIGNTPFNGCGSSPGGVANAITTAASNMSDAWASFSSFGSCVDIEAPGVSILSAGITSTSATATKSGGGMGAAHVAGVAAQYLQGNPGSTPAQVATALINNATLGLLTSVPAGTPNRLLYNGFMNHNSWDLLAATPPPPRGDLALGAASGLIYAIGGMSSAGAIPDVDAYNSATNSATNEWSAKAPLPAARESGDGAALVGGRIYAPGGFNAAGNLTRSLYAYNPTTNTWATRANIPVTSGCGVSGAIGGQLYVFTGCTGPTATDAGLLHRYNPATNSWTTLAAAPRAHRYPAGGVIGNRLYIVGGRRPGSASTNTLDVYNPATNTWTTRASMGTARRGAGGATVGGLLYVIGGRNAAGANLATVEAYNPTTNAWTAKAGLDLARSSLAAVASNGLIFAVGGRTNAGLTQQHTAYRP